MGTISFRGSNIEKSILVALPSVCVCVCVCMCVCVCVYWGDGGGLCWNKFNLLGVNQFF